MSKYVMALFTMIVFVAAGSAAAFAQPPPSNNTLTVQNGSGSPNTSGNIVRVEGANADTIAGLQFDLIDSSSNLTPTEVRLGSRAAGVFQLNYRISPDGDTVRVVLVDLQSGNRLNPGGPGDLVEVLYSVAPGAQVGFTIPLILDNVIASDPDGNELEGEHTDGVFTITQTQPTSLSLSSTAAELNEDGTVTVSIDNPDVNRNVFALQFTLTQAPDNLNFVGASVVGAAADSGFSVGTNETGDELIVTLTNLNGKPLPPNAGAIIELTYTGVNSGVTALNFSEVVISDEDAVEMPQGTHTGGAFTVTTANVAPSFTKGDDQAVNEDAGAQTVNGWATDINNNNPGSGQTVTFEITGNTRPDLFSVGPVVSPAGVLTYTSAPDSNGAATISIRARDSGGTANGGVDTSAVQTFTITINAVNDAPVITAVGAGTTNEDSPLTFSAANGNAITVHDVDVNGGELQVTLFATSTVTLGSTAGLTFSNGDGTDDGTMTFTGVLADINAALNGLTYKPTPDVNGQGTLNLLVNDQGNTGSGGDLDDDHEIAITINPVNDPPQIAAPGSANTNEDTPLVFSQTNGNAILISDVDVNENTEGGNDIQVTLTATSTVTLGSTAGIAITGGADGSSTVTFTGTLQNVNAALNGLTYRSDKDVNGAGELSIAVNDLGHTGQGGPQQASFTTIINIAPVNDPPVITAPQTQTTQEDMPITFNAANGNQISIDDDAKEDVNAQIQVTLFATSTVTLGSTADITITDGADASSTVTFTGTLQNVNAALNGLIYTPTQDKIDPGSLTIAVDDQGNRGTGGPLTASHVIAISFTQANDAPVLSGIETSPLVYTENDPPKAITATLTINDDSATLSGATVQISNNYSGGRDFLRFTNQNGITGSFNAQTGTMTLSGTASPALYQTALRSVTFDNISENPATDTRTVTFLIDDGFPLGPTPTALRPLVSSNPVSRNITVIAVNDPPVITTATLPNAFQDLAYNFQVSATDAESNPITFSLTNKPAWLSISPTGLMTGTPAISDTGNVSLTVKVKDTPGDSTLKGFALRVNPDKVPPVFTSGPSSQGTTDNRTSILFTSNKPVTATVRYGVVGTPSQAPGGLSVTALTDSVVVSALNTSHNVPITGLVGSTAYEYRVTMRDKNLNPATSPLLNFFTAAAPDTAEPNFVVLPAAVSRSDSALTIAWEADEPVKAVVRFVRANGVTLTPPIVDSTKVFQRKDQITFRKLLPLTEYDGQVELTDVSGNGPNKNPFNNNPARIVARTRATPDLQAPVLTANPTVKGITDIQATVLFGTNEPSISIVQYGLTNSLGLQVVDSTLVTDHSITLTGLTPDTTYFFRVSAVDPSGNQMPFTGNLSFRTKKTPDIIAPVYTFGPVTISVTDRSIIVRWGTNELSDTVLRIRRVGTTDSTTIVLPAFVTDHVVTVTGLLPKTQYRYTVSSADGSGNRSAERSATVTTLQEIDTTPPRFQSVPTVTFKSSDRFRVEWLSDEASDSRGQAGLTVADTTIEALDQSLVTRHVLTFANLAPNTRYFFRVRMRDASGNQAISALDSVRTNPAPDVTPPAISGIVARPGQTQAVIGFTTNESGDTRILISTDSSAVALGNESIADVFEDVAFVAAHSITVTGLDAGTRHYYRVQSTDPAGNRSALTPVIPRDFTTEEAEDTTPPVISGITASGITATEATISFTTNELANTTIVFDTTSSPLTLRAEDPDLETNHSITLTNLKPGRTYFYRVLSADQRNNTTTRPGSANPPKSFVTTAVAVDSIAPLITVRPSRSYASDTQVIITWATDELADDRVFYKQDLDSLFSEQPGPVGLRVNHLVTVSGLIAGATYDFVISSKDAAGNEVRFPRETIVFKVGVLFKIVSTSQAPGGFGRFTTLTAPDNQAPVILNGPSITSRDATNVTVQWVTDELSTSTVDFGTNNTLDQRKEDGTLVTSHTVTLNNLSPSTVYSYVVNSTDPSNNGPSTSVQSVVQTNAQPDVTPPVITAGPSASSTFISTADLTSATITWTTNELADSKVEFGTTSSLGEIKAVSEAVTNHSVILTRLTPGASISYRVSSTDQGGNGPTVSGIVTFTAASQADVTAPVLSNVSTTGTTNSKIAVTWNTNESATSVLLAIESGTTDTIAVANNTLKTTHSLAITTDNSGNPVKANTLYNLLVESQDASGNTGSQSSSVTTPAAPDTIPPSAPTTLTATPGNEQAQLSWSAVSSPDLAGYDVYKGTTRIASGVTATAYEATGLTNDVAVTFEVKAVDQSGNASGSSPQATATPAASQAPSKPTTAGTFIGGTTADVVSLTPILIVSNATPVSGRPTPTYSFAVYGDSVLTDLVTSISGIAQGTTGNPTHWQVTDPTLPNGVALLDSTRYFWRARANDTVTDGPWSNTATFFTSSAKPTAIELASFSAQSDRGIVNLTWRTFQDTGINGFRVYRSLNAAGPFELISSNLITSREGLYEFRDRDVTVNLVYYYQIEATGSVGQNQRFGPVSIRVTPPNAYSLEQNFPNPFNPTTTIRYELPRSGNVRLVVYNLLGQEVVTLVDAPQEAGFHTLQWNGLNTAKQRVASGVYFYRISIQADGKNEFSSAKKMLLLK